MRLRRWMAAVLAAAMVLAMPVWAAGNEPKVEGNQESGYTVTCAGDAGMRYTLMILKEGADPSALKSGDILYSAVATADDNATVTFSDVRLRVNRGADVYVSGGSAGRSEKGSIPVPGSPVTVQVTAEGREKPTGAVATLYDGDGRELQTLAVPPSGLCEFDAVGDPQCTLVVGRDGYLDTWVVQPQLDEVPLNVKLRPGDVNGDGQVTPADLTLVLKNMENVGPAIQPAAADLNGDGAGTGADVDLLTKYFLARNGEIPGYTTPEDPRPIAGAAAEPAAGEGLTAPAVAVTYSGDGAYKLTVQAGAPKGLGQLDLALSYDNKLIKVTAVKSLLKDAKGAAYQGLRTAVARNGRTAELYTVYSLHPLTEMTALQDVLEIQFEFTDGHSPDDLSRDTFRVETDKGAGAALTWFYGEEALKKEAGVRVMDGTYTAAEPTAVLTYPNQDKTKLEGTLTIAGMAEVGKTLTASLPGLSLETDYTLKWLRNSAFLTGETGQTYTITSADQGKNLMACAIGKGQYAGTLISNSIAIPAASTGDGGGGGGGGGGGAPAPVTPEKSPETPGVESGDGTATVKPEAVKDKDGGYTASVDAESAKGLAQAEVAVIAPVVGEDAEAVSVELSPEAAQALAKAGTVRVETPAASLDLSGAALAGLTGPVSLGTALRPDGTVAVTVTADGKAVEDLPGGLTTTLAAPEAGAGTVCVLVRPDGTEEVVRKSALTGDGMAALLDGSAVLKLEDRAKTFTDTGDHWAADSVAFVSARDLFQGTGEDVFSPGLEMDRGMLATVLYRLEGEPQAGTPVFADVAETDYFAPAVAWAGAAGIVTGSGDGFAPRDPVSREQLAAMLQRYAAHVGLETPAAGKLDDFADGEQVSGWAGDAVAWAVGAGIIAGKDGNRLDPAGTATRAEVAVMLQRFTTYLVTGGKTV